MSSPQETIGNENQKLIGNEKESSNYIIEQQPQIKSNDDVSTADELKHEMS